MTKYWGGPWQWNSSNPEMESYVAPGASFALVDLRNMETQSQNNYAGGVGNGLFCTEDTEDLGSDYTLLGIGAHIIETLPETGAASAWNSMFGVNPQGTYLVDYLAYTLTDGSDVEGATGPKPLMPGIAPVNEAVIHLAGHSVIWRNVVDVRGGSSKHAKAIRDRLQKDLQSVHDSEANDKHWRKYLASLKEKTGQAWDDPDEDYLLTAKMKAKSKGTNGKSRAEKPETSYTEGWTGGSDPTSGQTQAWAWQLGFSLGLSVSGGQLVTGSGGSEATIRMTSALSGSDNSSIAVFKAYSSGVGHQYPLCRKDSNNAVRTFYLVFAYNDGAAKQLWTYKYVTGTPTSLSTGTNTLTANDTWGPMAVGSTISKMKNGSSVVDVTDTAISSGLYGGIGGYATTTGFASDDIVIADYSAPAVPANNMIMGTYL